MSPNRKNITLHVQKIKNDVETHFKWIVDLIRQHRSEAPRILIYTRTIRECAQLYEYVTYELGNLCFWPEGASKKAANRLVVMYHSSTDNCIQEIVLKSLQEPNGIVRVVFATSALGMGVNIKGLHTVLNYGPPNDIESYIQAIGRAGLQSHAILMYHGIQLRHCE